MCFCVGNLKNGENRDRGSNRVLNKIRGDDKNFKKSESTVSGIVPLVKGEKKNNEKQSFWSG